MKDRLSSATNFVDEDRTRKKSEISTEYKDVNSYEARQKKKKEGKSGIEARNEALKGLGV